MLIKALIEEIKREGESTRKLLKAIPDSALNWKPSENSWTTAQLASHIAEIYNWHAPTFGKDVFDFATYNYEKGDITKAENIVAKFEENFKEALASLEAATEESMFSDWTLKNNGQTILGPVKRIGAIRGFLMSHLYHHRGEMIVYLRATGNKVPGLYGPTFEDLNG